MKTEKAKKKLMGSVASYLTRKGIENTVDASLTFQMLVALSEACEPLALESGEARRAAYERLQTLKNAAKPEDLDPIEEMAMGLINPKAIARQAQKKGKSYRAWVAHKIEHPRGKSALELAECHMKLGEIDVVLRHAQGEEAEKIRRQALNNAKYCLMAMPA